MLYWPVHLISAVCSRLCGVWNITSSYGNWWSKDLMFEWRKFKLCCMVQRDSVGQKCIHFSHTHTHTHTQICTHMRAEMHAQSKVWIDDIKAGLMTSEDICDRLSVRNGCSEFALARPHMSFWVCPSKSTYCMSFWVCPSKSTLVLLSLP